MTRTHRTVLALAFLAGSVASLAFGCRQILGVQDLGTDAVTCEAYCSTIQTACTGAFLQYESNAACMAYCAHLPVGTATDTMVNTLGCRVQQVNNVVNLGTGEGDCAAAGPNGDGLCGLDCESFCTAVPLICPQDFGGAPPEFKDGVECLTACARIPNAACPSYYVVPDTLPNVDSLQCRFYHLTAASLDPTVHCPHVLGEGFCTPVADGGEPCTDDAGTAKAPPPMGASGHHHH